MKRIPQLAGIVTSVFSEFPAFCLIQTSVLAEDAANAAVIFAPRSPPANPSASKTLLMVRASMFQAEPVAPRDCVVLPEAGLIFPDGTSPCTVRLFSTAFHGAAAVPRGCGGF